MPCDIYPGSGCGPRKDRSSDQLAKTIHGIRDKRVFGSSWVLSQVCASIIIDFSTVNQVVKERNTLGVADDYERYFRKIKERLTIAPILTLLKVNEPYTIYTDVPRKSMEECLYKMIM